MRKYITIKHPIGSEVRLVTELDTVRIVTGYFVRRTQVVYICRAGTEDESYHLDIELLKVEYKHKKIKGFKGTGDNS